MVGLNRAEPIPSAALRRLASHITEASLGPVRIRIMANHHRLTTAKTPASRSNGDWNGFSRIGLGRQIAGVSGAALFTFMFLP